MKGSKLYIDDGFFCNRSREHLFYKYMHILNYIKEWLYVIAGLIEKNAREKRPPFPTRSNKNSVVNNTFARRRHGIKI